MAVSYTHLDVYKRQGADLGASLDSLRIWKQTGDDAYEALTRVDSAGQLGAGTFLLVSNGSGLSVQYKGCLLYTSRCV